MTTTDVIINLGLSFIAGIPASVIANYLWEQIAKRGKRPLSINRIILKSFADIRSWVIRHNPFADTVADVGDALHLHRLKLISFRNLRDLEICFDAYVAGDVGEDPGSRLKSHAVIGQNGTGKSNLIEAIVTIFRDFGLDNDSSLDYELEYSIRGHFIRVKADLAKQRRPFVWVDGKAESQGYLVKNKQLLPSHVFAYYSGRNERLEALFQEHLRRFNRRQEISDEEVLPERLLQNFSASAADIRAVEAVRRKWNNEKTIRQFGDDKLRRLFYCRGGHSQLVLLSCLLSNDPIFTGILDDLNIESLESALFVLKQPHRLRELKEDDIVEGDPRFWFARGNVVSEFLDKLWQVSWAPIEHEESRLVDFRGRKERQNSCICSSPTGKNYRNWANWWGRRIAFSGMRKGRISAT
jgi:hypothetical protein